MEAKTQQDDTSTKPVANCDPLDAAMQIESHIFTIRGTQVMVDRDLAMLYGVETRALNQAVKRNKERFPETYMFQMNDSEFEDWKSQIVTSNHSEETIRYVSMGLRRAPYVFTEQGVAMLSAVLHSNTAVGVSIRIMDAFVSMRRFLASNAIVYRRLEDVERHLVLSDIHQQESDKRIDELFKRMETHNNDLRQGIFFQGEIFDAYVLFEQILQNATSEIILIDNYVDLSVLERLSKKQLGVSVKIFTHPHTAISPLDVSAFNAQYPQLDMFTTTKMHDRYLIVDNKELYHIGASLKDLGKKCFAFTKMDDADVLIAEILKNI